MNEVLKNLLLPHFYDVETVNLGNVHKSSLCCIVLLNLRRINPGLYKSMVQHPIRLHKKDSYMVPDKEFNTNEDIIYLRLNQIPQRFPAFTISSLRWLRFNGDINGFNRCVRKIGRNVVVSVREFKNWIEEQQSTTIDNKKQLRPHPEKEKCLLK